MTAIPATTAASPTSTISGDPFATSGAVCAEQLHASSFNEFIVNDNETNVTVLEVRGNVWSLYVLFENF
jgi:hypothetical protein